MLQQSDKNKSDTSARALFESCNTSGRALFDSCKGGYDDKCCPLVVDTLSWLALLAGIAVATFLLRQAIIDNIGKKRKKRSVDGRSDIIWRGGFNNFFILLLDFNLIKDFPHCWTC